MVGDFLVPSHGAEVEGLVAADLLLPVVGQHLAVLFVVVPTGKLEVIELQRNAEPELRRVEHPQPLGHDFLADAVSGNDGNALFSHSCAPKNMAASASGSFAGAGKIGAPWHTLSARGPESRAAPCAGSTPSTRP